MRIVRENPLYLTEAQRDELWYATTNKENIFQIKGLETDNLELIFMKTLFFD